MTSLNPRNTVNTEQLNETEPRKVAYIYFKELINNKLKVFGLILPQARVQKGFS